MSNGSVVPPDIREQMESRSRRTQEEVVRGVGVKAAENESTARQRELAMNPDAVMAKEVRKQLEPELKEEAPTKCKNSMCNAALDPTWKFCSRCGREIADKSAAAKLGITFTEEDLSDYLFKGYVVRELSLLGSHKVTLKSSQPIDMDEIDDYIMNGKWAKNKDGTERKISDFYLRQMNSMCITAASVQKMDNTSIGGTISERIEWLNERGSALVDMVSQRAVWFNQALTEFLNDKDAVLGS